MRQEQSSMFKTEYFRQTRRSFLKEVKLFERLEEENRSNDIRPRSKESVRFWSEIWDQRVTYNEVKW